MHRFAMSTNSHCSTNKQAKYLLLFQCKMCHHKNRPHAENDSKYDRYDSADGFVSFVSLASLSFYVINIAVLFFLLKDIIKRYFTYMISHLCRITCRITYICI